MEAGIFDLKHLESSPFSHTPIFDLWLAVSGLVLLYEAEVKVPTFERCQGRL